MIKLTSVALAAGLAIFTLGAGSSPVQADQVKVPVMSQGDRNSITLPRTGQSRAAVRQKFGDPASTSGPVGDPPISHWHYDRFVVYFEYDHVIHAVARHNR